MDDGGTRISVFRHTVGVLSDRGFEALRACRAGRASVGLEPSDARTSSGLFKLTRNAVPAPEVHLVRRLPIERAVRKNAIMLVDVEDDQALEGRQVVKLM